MHYRLLPPGEWASLEPFFKERSIGLPSPNLAQIAVAEDGGQIVGFLVRQLVPHVEPLSIAPEYRGKVSWKRLANMLDMNQTFVFADSPERERMCELAGFQKIEPFTVWIKG